MRLIRLDDGRESPQFAMARDHALAVTAARPGSFAWAVRFHGWSSPCLTYGRGQKPPRHELAAAARDRLAVAGRPTGGGRVMHLPGDFAVTLAVMGTAAPGSFRGAARDVAVAIAAGLRHAGLEAEVVTRHTRAASASRAEVCFARIEREEVAARGVKVAGVALARLRRAVLVQAAIPLADSGRTHGALISHWDELRAGAAHALEGVTAQRVADGLIAALERSCGAAFESVTFWDDEASHHAGDLLRERYARPPGETGPSAQRID